jgi:hypothetical protein
MVILQQIGLIYGFRENGKPNKIKVNRERYLKFTVTDLNDPNEPYTPSVDSPEVQGMDTFFDNFMEKVSPITNPEQQSKIVAYMQPTTSTQRSHVPDVKSNLVSLFQRVKVQRRSQSRLRHYRSGR